MTNPFEAFTDYYWDQGLPVGRNSVAGDSATVCYKVVSDPYRQRLSVELYRDGRFESVVYDSALFDFRWLKPAAQVGWQKETLSETETEVVSLIRTIEDRVILKEVYRFDGPFCLECRAFSPQEIPVSLQRIFYTDRGAPFNGVVLYDMHDHPVTFKRYDADSEGQFSQLLEERWNFKEIPEALTTVSSTQQ